jgi:hypothetical protein
MISLEVRRTLVKSPPELWAELSDPARLADHLRELGEIRIVGTVPEQMVEWEAQDARGRVLIKPSGWGTKVTLTALRQMPQPEPPLAPESLPQSGSSAPVEPAPLLASRMPQPEPLLPPQPDAEPEPDARVEPAVEPDLDAQSEPRAALDLEARREPDAADLPAPDPEPQLEPRRGFLARLFGRRKRIETQQDARPELSETARPAPDAAVDLARDVAAIATQESETAVLPAPHETGMATNEPATDAPPAPEETPIAGERQEATDISAALKRAEEVAAEQVKAMLTSMLDRLGAAHHRPFSRA